MKICRCILWIKLADTCFWNFCSLLTIIQWFRFKILQLANNSRHTSWRHRCFFRYWGQVINGCVIRRELKFDEDVANCNNETLYLQITLAKKYCIFSDTRQPSNLCNNTRHEIKGAIFFRITNISRTIWSEGGRAKGNHDIAKTQCP